MSARRLATEDLVKALRVLARDISSPDGTTNTAIAEAADRLEEQMKELRVLEDGIWFMRKLKRDSLGVFGIAADDDLVLWGDLRMNGFEEAVKLLEGKR